MPVTTTDRVLVAAQQLDVAIELFLAERSDVSALSLAGAAEEVLGQAVKQHGGENAMQQAYVSAATSHRMLHHGKVLTRKDFADGENYARNAAKHMRAPSDTTLTADLRLAAQWMIVRACANFDRLDLPRTDRMHEFDNWFYEHEVGV